MKINRTVLAEVLLGLLVCSCVKYDDQPNKGLDYSELDVCFKASLPRNYTLSEGSAFGIRGLCTRGEEQNVDMASKGVARYAFAPGNDTYLFKSSDSEAIIGLKNDHNYHFYAYYPYDASVTDLSAIKVSIPSVIDWTPTAKPDLSMLLAAKTTVTSIVAPVPLEFAAVAQCVLTIRIPKDIVPAIKSLKVHPANEASFKGAVAWSGTYDIYKMKSSIDASKSSKSITVNFGSGYVLPEGYTEISFVMGAFSYPSGGFELIITKADGTSLTRKMYQASQVFNAGSTTTYTLS